MRLLRIIGASGPLFGGGGAMGIFVREQVAEKNSLNMKELLSFETSVVIYPLKFTQF